MMSVIATIHQPNIELFLHFDNIYVLSIGGKNIYCGRPQDLGQHLLDLNTDSHQIDYPIEEILKIGSNSLDENINKLSKINSKTKELVLNRKEEVFETNNGVKRRTKRFSPSDFCHLLIRNIICSYVYEWKSLVMQIILYILLAFNLSILYKREISLVDGCVNKKMFFYDNFCEDSEESLRKESQLKQNIQYNLSFITGTSFIQIIITTMTFSSKVNVFLNEHRNCKLDHNLPYDRIDLEQLFFKGWYSTGAYFWSKSLVDSIPILFALMIFSHLINYYSSIDMYFTYLYCLSLTVLCAQSFGHLSGIIFSDNTTVAVFVSVAFYLVSSNLSNIFIPLNDFHYVFKAISNLSFLKHSINCILLKIYGFGRCSDKQFSLILYKYDISEDIFTESLLNLIFILILLKFLTLYILILKTNAFSSKERTKQGQIDECPSSADNYLSKTEIC